MASLKYYWGYLSCVAAAHFRVVEHLDLIEDIALACSWGGMR